MRVQEGKSCATLGMVKRKHRLRKKKANEDAESSDDAGPGGALCQHLNKAVNINLVRKAIKQHGLTGKCMACDDDNSDFVRDKSRDAIEDDIYEITLWLCLQCGNQGCGRNSKYQHAIKHHQTPRSACHALVVNLKTWCTWCYDCDDDVSLDSSKSLTECVELVKKQSGAAPAQPVSGKRGSQHKKDQQQHTDETSQQAPQPDTQHNRPNAPVSLYQHTGLPKVKGLSNLGNTCFFNAVMQNLSQTPILQVVLSEKIKKDLTVQLGARCRHASEEIDEASASSDEDKLKFDIEPLNITLAEGGTLSNSVLSFLKDMQSTGGKMVVTPSHLFGQLCKKSPRFKGYQQHDSHELLRCLLDGMKAEEVKRSQHAILKSCSVSESTKSKSKVDDDTRLRIKAYGHQVKHTFVDSIFGGVFISTVMCEQCSVPSQIFEPFLDISLPVTEEKTARPNYGTRKKDLVPQTATVNTELDDKPSSQLTKKAKRKAKKEAKKKAKEPDAEKSAGNKAEGSGEENEHPDAKDEEQKQGKEVIEGSDAERSGTVQQEAEPIVDAVADESTSQSMQCNAVSQVLDSRDQAGLTAEQVAEGGLSSEQVAEGGLTAEQVAEHMRRDAGESLEDTDSNKVNVSSSDQNLSDSDADIEDNLDGLPSQDAAAVNNNVPANSQTRNERLSNSTSDLRKPYAVNCSQQNNPINSLNGTKNRDLIVQSDKDAERTKSQESLDSINSGYNSSAALNRTDSQDCDEITNILGRNQIFENDAYNNKVQDVTDTLKNLKLDMSQAEIENGVKFKNGIAHDELFLKGDSNQSNILKSMQNLSRANTPQSPKLSRSSSMKSQTKSKHMQLEAKLKATRSLANRYHAESHECSVQSCLNQFTAAELLTGNNQFGCETCTKRKYANVDKDVKREMVFTSASKQVLLFTPPAVLTLHLKRFQQVGFSFRKVSRHVDFPLLLDLAPYCSSLAQGIKAGQTRVMYSLYGIVEHSGRLTGGHYTAFVKVRPNSTQHIMQFLQHCDIKSINLARILESLTRSLDAHESRGAEGGAEMGHGEAGDGVVPNPGWWYYISDSRVSETTEAKALQCQAYILFYERVL